MLDILAREIPTRTTSKALGTSLGAAGLWKEKRMGVRRAGRSGHSLNLANESKTRELSLS